MSTYKNFSRSCAFDLNLWIHCLFKSHATRALENMVFKRLVRGSSVRSVLGIVCLCGKELTINLIKYGWVMCGLRCDPHFHTVSLSPPPKIKHTHTNTPHLYFFSVHFTSLVPPAIPDSQTDKNTQTQGTLMY